MEKYRSKDRGNKPNEQTLKTLKELLPFRCSPDFVCHAHMSEIEENDFSLNLRYVTSV